MSVSCDCCVLSGRGLCDELVLRPEESYRLWCLKCVIAKPRKMRRPGPPRGCRAIEKYYARQVIILCLLSMFDVSGETVAETVHFCTVSASGVCYTLWAV
jgi:hypothetical protein